MAKKKKKTTSRKATSTRGRRKSASASRGRSRAASPSKSVRLATVESVATPKVLAAVTAALDESIDVGDTVVTLVALVSVRPLPPVPIPPGTQGRVSQKAPVGNTIGYIVDFTVNGAVRSAPAFSGQIREV
jgi:hypothetical protein